jgi:hypothetical protein
VILLRFDVPNILLTISLLQRDKGRAMSKTNWLAFLERWRTSYEGKTTGVLVQVQPSNANIILSKQYSDI